MENGEDVKKHDGDNDNGSLEGPYAHVGGRDETLSEPVE